MDSRMRRRTFWEELIIQGIAIGGLILSLRMAMKYLDPYREQREQARKRSAFLNQMLGRKLDLNEFEQLLAANVMNPHSIDVELDDVSGLDDLVNELELKVLIPMMETTTYTTTLWKPARGVLLYGPPGTGKTMLAKALAKHSGCYFLNITASSIMSKWLGDANKLVRAIFTLAEKLQPCIIFIDEVDALLGKRGGGSEHEASLQVKTEFMQLWDGMESCKGQRIVVMGATNRPGMVDEAVLRRFSVQHEVGMPDAAQRSAILRTYLRRHVREVGRGAVMPELLDNKPVPGITGGKGARDWLAEQAQGFSGSDLMELCSQAAQRVLNDYWVAQGRTRKQLQSARRAGSSSSPSEARGADSSSSRDEQEVVVMRPVTLQDFVQAMPGIAHATSKADHYTMRTEGNRSIEFNPLQLLQMLARMNPAVEGGPGSHGPAGNGADGTAGGPEGSGGKRPGAEQ